MTTPAQAIQARAIEVGKLAGCATTSTGSGHPTTALAAGLTVNKLLGQASSGKPADDGTG